MSNAKASIADYRPKLLKKVANRYQIPRTYNNHHDLLKDNEVNTVIVVTPRTYTGPTVFDCLKAGKNVISEKPMAGSYDQARELFETAQNMSLRYLVGYMKRYDEGVQLGKRILDRALKTKEMGEILNIRSCYMEIPIAMLTDM